MSNIPEHVLLSNKLAKLVKHPLSDEELKIGLGKDLKIIMYPDLATYNSIEQLLPKPFDSCILLIVESENENNISGHWCALLRYDGIYAWFDPFNPRYYDLIHWMGRKTKLKNHEDEPHLT